MAGCNAVLLLCLTQTTGGHRRGGWVAVSP